MREIDFSAISDMDIYNMIRTVVRKIASICNPVFFLFSGYLFFANIDTLNKQIYTKKIKTRINTLLIPYILWNSIRVILSPVIIFGGRIIKNDGDWNRFAVFFNDLLDKGIGNVFWHYHTWGNEINILGWPMPNMGPISVPMWFLQTLIVLTVLSPIIYLICKYLKIYGILILGLLYYTNIWFLVPGFSVSAIFFFALGSYCGIYKKNLIVEMRRYKILGYIISIITLIPAVYYDYNGISTYNYFSPIFILAMVVSSINIGSCLIEKGKIKVNKTLSQATFFVYALHTVLVLHIVGLVFDKIFNSNAPIFSILRYFVVTVITAYICVGIYCIMKRIVPEILKVLSGNR